MKKFLKILAWITGLFLLLAILTVTVVDWTDYRDMAYFQDTMATFDALDIQTHPAEHWIAGWAKANHTPDQPAALVGYKPRGKYEFVQDSSFVRALVLGNGTKQVAILGYELLIIHPYLAAEIQNSVEAAGLPVDYLYFTATHTHSGMGGYMPGLAGKLAFGGLDEGIVEQIKAKTLSALRQAIANQDTVTLSYRKVEAPDLVENRFVPEGPVDPFVRILELEKANGEKGLMLTYSAHATCLSSKFMGLSGDYPHYLMEELEASEAGFALYAAGTVGSHRPVRVGNDAPGTIQYAHKLDSTIWAGLPEVKQVMRGGLTMQRIPILLRDSHYRISTSLRLRPWVFRLLFGQVEAHFDVIRIGNLLMIGSSGEISGVFYKEWEAIAEANGLELLITSFNGSYIGYITPDELYNEKFHEVREMNWFGPYNGTYFDLLIRRTIEEFGR